MSFLKFESLFLARRHVFVMYDPGPQHKPGHIPSHYPMVAK